MPKKIDPIVVEVISNVLRSIAEQAGLTLIRCALSPNIKERLDSSTALLTGDGKVIAQATHIPMHLGSMLNVGAGILTKYRRRNIRPGDVFMNNDPYLGGSSHLSDFTITTPVFYHGELMFFAINTAHHVDVGGRVPGSTSPDCRSIYEEGIRIPLVRIAQGGKLQDDILELIALNCRDPEERIADIRGQIAANALTERPLVHLCEKYGSTLIKQAIRESLAYTERKVRARLRELPEGDYEFVNYMDNDGINDIPVPIKVKVSIQDGRVRVDFTGSGPEAAGAMNVVRSALLAGVYFAFRAALDPSILPNEGFFKVIDVYAPAGTILNPRRNAAVGVRTDTVQKVVDVVFGALFQAMPPDRVIAGSNAVASAWLFYGHNPRTGRDYTYLETVGGGSGARSNKDGLDAVHVYSTNTSNLPVEVLESEYPLLVEQYSMVPDSGGAGKYRGGLGIRRDIRALYEAFLTTRSEGHISRPWPLFGGRPGAPGSIVLNPDTGDEVSLPAKKSNIRLKAGDVASMRTPGAGGFGNPGERDPDLIRRDISSGVQSPASAREDYGPGNEIIQPVKTEGAS
jgi:N-methylhydantoinase B